MTERKKLPLQEQTKILQEVFKFLHEMQMKLPGEYFTSLSQVKDAVGTVNNSIVYELEDLEKEAKEVKLRNPELSVDKDEVAKAVNGFLQSA